MKPVIKFYTLFNSLPGLIHGFSTRQGGVSLPPFDSLNLGLSTPDDPQAVSKNRKLFFKTLGIPAERVVFPEQVHSDTIKIVRQPGNVAKCDALITDRPNLYLSIQTADCFPVFLVDPQKDIVAIVHSGWQGTARNIVGKTIRKMKVLFNVRAENILAVIGPGVQKNCYQVDGSVIPYFDPDFYKDDGPGHYLLDLQGAIRQQILNEGVPQQQVETDPDCTHCRSDLYYSYRRDGQRSGRMMGIIGLREK